MTSKKLKVNMKFKLNIAVIIGFIFALLFQLTSTKVLAQNRDTFSDARKVNEYVSWYLNGTIRRPEYDPLSLHYPEDVTRIVDYSGPLNKRLPLAYQHLMKIKAIDNALTENPTTNLPENHNQIVVCASKFMGAFGEITPHQCYPYPGEEADPDVYRLKDWDGDLQGLAGWLNWLPGFDWWNSRKPPLPWGEDQEGHPMTDLKYRKYYQEWRGNTCVVIPIVQWLICVDTPWVHNEWAELFPYVPLANTTDKDALHGVGSIGLQPNEGTVACFSGDTSSCSNPVPPDERPDYPATRDYLNGDNPQVVHEPVLYYPHTLETVELSDMLNEMFTPTDCHIDPEHPEDGCVSYEYLDTGPRTADYENLGCEFIEERSNPGDYLFQSSQDSRTDDLAVYVDIQVEKIGCPAGPIDSWIADCGCIYPNDCPTRHGCELTSVCIARNSDLDPYGEPYTDNDCINPNNPDDPLDCAGTYPDICQEYPICSGNLNITIPTTPQIPYARNIWQSTVVGRDSTFRRIFPKVEEGAPVSCIADIPGTTSTQYTPLPNSTYTPLTGVETPLTTNSGSGLVNSQLYFPWQGTVYEYFLRGIQTAIRPKGYGNPIPNGTECGGLLPEVGDCRMWLFMPDSSGQLYYDKIIAASSGVTCDNKGSFNPFWAIAIALNENAGLMTDDANGMSNSHFGCNLSQFQTIEEKMDCMFRTFRSYCESGMSTEQMLQTYGYPAGYFHWPLSVLYGGTTNPPYPPLFGSGYNISQLVANLLSTDWIAAYPEAPAIFCPDSPVLIPPPY
jgi:hypothetical protein